MKQVRRRRIKGSKHWTIKVDVCSIYNLSGELSLCPPDQKGTQIVGSANNLVEAKTRTMVQIVIPYSLGSQNK